jgi:hypothetical protein
MIKYIKKSFDDYVNRKITLGSILILIFIFGSMILFLWRIIGYFMN